MLKNCLKLNEISDYENIIITVEEESHEDQIYDDNIDYDEDNENDNTKNYYKNLKNDYSNYFYILKSKRIEDKLTIINSFNNILIYNYNCDLSGMFFNYVSLSSLPDLLKWNTDKVNNMRGLLNNCESLSLLSSLSNLSKWNTDN